jgi:hypothetical protein
MNSLVLSGQERQKLRGFPLDHGLQKYMNQWVFRTSRKWEMNVVILCRLFFQNEGTYCTSARERRPEPRGFQSQKEINYVVLSGPEGMNHLGF